MFLIFEKHGVGICRLAFSWEGRDRGDKRGDSNGSGLSQPTRSLQSPAVSQMNGLSQASPQALPQPGAQPGATKNSQYALSRAPAFLNLTHCIPALPSGLGRRETEAPCSQLCPDTWTHTLHSCTYNTCAASQVLTHHTHAHTSTSRTVCFTVCSTSALESLLSCT